MERVGGVNKGVVGLMFSYTDFIRNLHSGNIRKIIFKVKEYQHYKNCSILRVCDILPSGNKITLFIVKLSDKKDEKVSFLNKFKEDYKLFNFGKKGKYTLKQVWEYIDIIELDMKND